MAPRGVYGFGAGSKVHCGHETGLCLQAFAKQDILHVGRCLEAVVLVGASWGLCKHSAQRHHLVLLTLSGGEDDIAPQC